MRKFLYKMLWKIFSIKSIMLIDFDGECNLRLLRKYANDTYYAKRMGLVSSNVMLMPDRTIKEGRSYVTNWLPLYPNDLKL